MSRGEGKERAENPTVLPAKIHLSYELSETITCFCSCLGVCPVHVRKGQTGSWAQGCVHGEWFSPTGSAAVLPLQSPTTLWENRSGWGQQGVTSPAHPRGSCLTDHVTSHRAVPGPPLLHPPDPYLFLSIFQAVLQLQELQNVQSGAQCCSLGGG